MLNDAEKTECSVCYKKCVDVRTEVLTPSDEARRENRITKIIIFRCENHLNTNLDEMERLALAKSREGNTNNK